jgi:hypothetical protein
MRPENKSFAKFVGIPVLALIGLSAVMGGGGSSGSDTDTPVAKNAAEAAQVNDVVTIIYPHSTIMCEQRDDMSKVYVVGEMMLRQTMRIENDVWKALDAEKAGQKSAMAKAYSCEWAPKKEVRIVVQQKDISTSALGQSAAFGGTENAGRAATRTEHNQRLRLYPREPLQSLLSY